KGGGGVRQLRGGDSGGVRDRDLGGGAAVGGRAGGSEDGRAGGPSDDRLGAGGRAPASREGATDVQPAPRRPARQAAGRQLAAALVAGPARARGRGAP